MSTDVWQSAIHEYEPDVTGRCQGGWFNDQSEWVECLSSQRSSVLHDDCEADFRQSHDHGGGDCMCFEDENRPSYHEVMRMTCYPTPEEIAEEERQRVLIARRNRRIYALSQGKAITRMAQRLDSTTPRVEIDRYIRRATKLHGWGVRA